jgi:hypothetical protein
MEQGFERETVLKRAGTVFRAANGVPVRSRNILTSRDYGYSYSKMKLKDVQGGK